MYYYESKASLAWASSFLFPSSVLGDNLHKKQQGSLATPDGGGLKPTPQTKASHLHHSFLYIQRSWNNQECCVSAQHEAQAGLVTQHDLLHTYPSHPLPEEGCPFTTDEISLL